MKQVYLKIKIFSFNKAEHQEELLVIQEMIKVSTRAMQNFHSKINFKEEMKEYSWVLYKINRFLKKKQAI